VAWIRRPDLRRSQKPLTTPSSSSVESAIPPTRPRPSERMRASSAPGKLLARPGADDEAVVVWNEGDCFRMVRKRLLDVCRQHPPSTSTSATSSSQIREQMFHPVRLGREPSPEVLRRGGPVGCKVTAQNLEEGCAGSSSRHPPIHRSARTNVAFEPWLGPKQ